ncbi:hypothetical protein KL86DES1_20978 [uncultured Desulfovibrio sp.]|uniref:Uncharacterized protein n=1 Tax=uncultured Desulfovibrio sp. TaxID=167968 RepID=A0A212L665_9BACT|nr:hypothetical protein KL86DES1_20978 [uncultured Desulfovibrio sp.]VZH33879.1 conserved protein of unknown function [Desulfovibrio sp. 86]
MRLCGGRLLTQSPEQLQAAAFRRRRSLTAGDSIAGEIALIEPTSPPPTGQESRAR